MRTNVRSRVTLRPDAIAFDELAPVPAERTYAREFSVEDVLGEGGMGRVIAARDQNLGRRVAIKELRPEARQRADLWGRFVREAQIGGQLEHPNIVPIYGFELSPDGGPAFVMQLIDGESLADYIDRVEGLVRSRAADAPSLKERVAKMLPICDAIAYAHGRGVLHRDLKPENIMLGPHNVVLVTDWGIARVESDEDELRRSGRPGPNEPTRAEDDSGASRPPAAPTSSGIQSAGTSEAAMSATVVAQDGPGSTAPTLATPSEVGPSSGPTRSVKTAHGAVMGTPQYMSPEQAVGLPVGPASDQYSLGLMLFELATLRTARSHVDASVAYSQALLGEHYVHTDHTGEDLDPRLSAIVHRATQKDAPQRYPTVDAFAADVRAFTRDEEVSVLPDSKARKLLRVLQKHPARSVSLIGLVLLLLAGWALVSTQRAATRATAARRDAEALNQLTSAVLGEGRTIERYLLDLEKDLAGFAETVRVRLSDDRPLRLPIPAPVTSADLLEGRAPGLVKNPVDGTSRSYRTPVFIVPPGAAPEAQLEATKLSAAQSDLVELYLRAIDETAVALPQAEREALMLGEQHGIVRLMVALESGLFVQFPARGDFPPDFDARHTEWYERTLAAKGSTFLRPKFGPLGHIPRMGVTRPIESGGRVMGAVAAGIWMKALVDLVGARGAAHLREAFLATSDGKVVASRALLDNATQSGGLPEAPVGLPTIASAPLRRALSSGRETGYVVDGERLFVYTRLSVEDWALVHEYPRTGYLELVR